MITVIGNFPSEETANIGGQHIRTETVFNLVRDRYPDVEVEKIDIAASKWRALRHLLFARDGSTIILPGRRLVALLAFILTLRFRFAGSVAIVAVGGWLPDMVKTNRWIRSGLKRANRIHLQLPSMALALDCFGFDNAGVLSNFRRYEKMDRSEADSTSVNIRFVFLSRVCSEKGIELAIEAVVGRHDQSSLAIYGPIQEGFEDAFRAYISVDPRITYHGVIKNDRILDMLAKHDVLLFPTSYEGEGFPGVLLEASYAGLYCVASDHLYNREVVENYCRGEVSKLQDFQKRVLELKRADLIADKKTPLTTPRYSELVESFDFFSR